VDGHLESYLSQCSSTKRSLSVLAPRPSSQKSNKTTGSSEVDDTVQLPSSSPEIESLIGRWRIFNQVEIIAQNGFVFHKETFDLQELLLRRAFEMESRERKMKSQLATSIPTPSSSSNVPSTPFSTQESSINGVLAPQSLDARRMLPPAPPASPSSVRSSSHANSLSAQGPTNYAVTQAPDAIREPPNQGYQSIERNQKTRAASPLPAAQYSGYPHERQRQKLGEPLAQLHSPQGYSGLDHNASLVPAASGNLPSEAQPALVNQGASHPSITSRTPPRSRHANSQVQSTYRQYQNEASGQIDSQRRNMVRQFPGSSFSFGNPAPSGQHRIQEDLAQFMQIASELFSRLGMAMPSTVPAVLSQANLLAPFEEQSNQSMLPPQPQTRETDRDSTQAALIMGPNNPSQVILQCNAQRLATSRNESVPQGASGMQEPQHFQAAAPQGPSQNYYHHDRAGRPVLLNQGFPQNSNNGRDQANLISQPEVSALPGQQFQMQPQQQELSDNRDLDAILGLDVLDGFFDDNSNWNEIQNSGNGGANSGFIRSGRQGEGGHL
jgi:hypothetical protein